MLKMENGRIAKTILIKMLPSEGRNPIQRYLRENLQQYDDYDDLEEELHKELYRREAETDKPSGINQISEDAPEDDKEKVAEEEWAETTVWSDEW